MDVIGRLSRSFAHVGIHIHTYVHTNMHVILYMARFWDTNPLLRMLSDKC